MFCIVFVTVETVSNICSTWSGVPVIRSTAVDLITGTADHVEQIFDTVSTVRNTIQNIHGPVHCSCLYDVYYIRTSI